MSATYSPLECDEQNDKFSIPFSNSEDDVLTESEMWSVIERDIGALPVYLKNILSINGYNHLLSLEELDEQSIQDVEKFARENMKNYVPNTEAYFYIFKENPSDFRILSGHRKLLLKLRDRIRQNGVHYYTQLKVPPPMMQLKPEQLFFVDNQSMPTSPKQRKQKRNHIPEIYSEEDKIRLLVYNWFTKYTDEILEMHTVGAAVCDSDDKVYGIIACPVCSAQVKIGAEKNKNGSNRWIISNYVKHFQKYHGCNFKDSNGFKIEVS